MTTTRLTIQPIHFTAQAHLWREFYRKLGLNRITGDDDLVEIWVAGSGLIVLAEVEGGSPLEGQRIAEFTVPDLEAYTQSLVSAGVTARSVELPHRRGLAIDLPHGRVHVSQLTAAEGAAHFDPELINLGVLLYGPVSDVAAGAEALAPYGLTPRIASDSGGWTDLIGNGLFAFHEGELRTVEHEVPNQPVIQTFMETRDVGAYMTKLESQGLEVALIDEAYGRTLNITQPDGAMLTVNETQRDLYGYHRLDGAEARA